MRMMADERSPAELRDMLGANLQLLAASAESISALCRELGINRTQFNRYRAGESFPRPDVLYRICRYFDVDARILLEPVEKLRATSVDLLHHPEIAEFVGAGSVVLDESQFPSGFYRFSRRSFVAPDRYLRGLVYVYRRDGYAFIRGYEAKEAMRQQDLAPTPRNREFRGFLMPQESGIAALVSRRDALTISFNFLSRVPSFENNYWVGYVTRTVPESASGHRVTRLVYEYLGRRGDRVRGAARETGLCSAEALPVFHRTQLKTETVES
ncbi:helix-turn-helix domain-containing protein [Roseivivax sp. CAU 1761]